MPDGPLAEAAYGLLRPEIRPFPVLVLEALRRPVTLDAIGNRIHRGVVALGPEQVAETRLRGSIHESGSRRLAGAPMNDS